MIALYLGEINEEKILEITYPFYAALLSEISRKLNYEAIVNLFGNGSASGGDVSEIIEMNNPFNFKERQKPRRFTLQDAKFMQQQ